MEGLLAARQYFRGPSAHEKELYENISYLWNTVEWDWYRRSPQAMRLLALVARFFVAHHIASPDSMQR